MTRCVERPRFVRLRNQGGRPGLPYSGPYAAQDSWKAPRSRENTSSGRVEIHTATAATGYQGSDLHTTSWLTPTTSPTAGSKWQEPRIGATWVQAYLAMTGPSFSYVPVTLKKPHS